MQVASPDHHSFLKTVRTTLLWVLKFGTTAGLLWLAFRRVPMKAIGSALVSVHSSWAAAAVLAYFAASIPLDTIRLEASGIQADEPPVPFRVWLDLYLESRPFFYLLPANAGADGLIWYRLRKMGWSHGGCGFTFTLTRLWGLAVWAVIAGLSLLWSEGARSVLNGSPSWLTAPTLWLMIGFAALIASALFPSFLSPLLKIRSHPFRIGPVSVSAISTILLALAIGGSVWLAARAAGTPLPIFACLGLIAWFNFAMLLPISLGGLGIQEALVLRLGQPYGYEPAQLLAFSALIHLARLLPVLLGTIWYLRMQRDPASRVPLGGHPILE